jgi:hypothetical protein
MKFYFGKKAAGVFLAASIAAASASPAQAAPQYSAWGSVQWIMSGWTQDTMAVIHSAPMVNPGGCSVTNAGYATNPADAGRSLFHTIALSAFLNRKEVRFVVDGCVFNKPRIIGVDIR